MSQKKLYIGNLSFNTNQADLRAAFEAYGTVESLEIVTDRDTGQSRGFGFIEMGSDSEAQDAIAGMDGQQFEGRQLTVNVAKPRAKREGGGGFDRGGRGGFDRGGRGGGGRRW